MIEVDEALSLVLQHAQPKGPSRSEVADAIGLILAEDITSDVDSPPHDKSLVDGYALRSSDVTGGMARLRILEEVTAGEVPTHSVAGDTATRIMTGAPIPDGADAVVMVEQTETDGESQVTVRDDRVHPGQHIMRRATSLAIGDTVLRAGHQIRPIEVGLLSEVGRTEVAVIPRATVAILATGNELITAHETPAAGQIRNSNGPMLCALAQRAGGQSIDLGIARDERSDLEQLISDGLESDMLVLSGGVSAGVLDLVPGVLSDLGVRQVFHKVNLKPGKPLWFGIVQRDGEHNSLVFGLPGNPVSSLVCFELFVRPAIGAIASRNTGKLDAARAKLACNHLQRGSRPTYWPARFIGETVEPLNWQGSADLRTLVDANCLIYFPGGDHEYKANEFVDIWSF